jgi:hypothetical protein
MGSLAVDGASASTRWANASTSMEPLSSANTCATASLRVKDELTFMGYTSRMLSYYPEQNAYVFQHSIDQKSSPQLPDT